MPNEFYPSVSTLVTIDDLPQELSFIQTGLSAVFDHVYFRDLQFTRSPKGDSAYYSLTLILNRSVGFTIPGAEIRIALNPDFETGSMTAIPVTLEYEWKLLALLKKVKRFTVGGFSFNADAVFELLADITGVTKNDLLENALFQFTGATDPLSAVNEFIDDANTRYGIAVPHTSLTDFKAAIAEALLGVSIEAEKDPFTIIYEVYIESITPEEALDRVKGLFAPFFEIDPVEKLKEILIPKINASLSLAPAGIGIIFPRKFLTPLDASNNLLPFPETGADTDKMSILGFGAGKFSFSTESGFGYDEELSATLNYPSMIGNTGLIINLQNAKLDLSRKKNIPEATQDGRPEDFMGVYIQEVSITLPDKWFKQPDHTTAKIYGRKLLIGTGGVSGEIGLEATVAGHALPPGQKPAIKVNLGENDGFELGFQKFSLTFKQNAVTACDIAGYMKIKGFKDSTGDDAQIDIKVAISDNGDFSITASEDQGISVIKIPDILNVNIKSLSVGRKDDKFYVAVSGNIDFADQSGSTGGGFIGDNLPKDIEIQKLLIWQDGTFEFEGGGIELRKPLTLKLGPAELSITALHFGSHEQQHGGQLRKYKFFGFDGGVSVKPGGIDARGDGIKFYFTVDNGPGKSMHVFVRIQSIAIDLMIPGTASAESAAVIMKGYLSMKAPDTSGSGSDAGTEYAGGIELTLPKLKIAGSAAMRFNPSVPAFVIDIGLELPTAIPLGSTGLGIYGFRGLLGLRYVASRESVGLAPDAEWWQYYKKKTAPDNKEGIFISKMDQREGFSVGAGVSLCTAPDTGRTFSAKLFFMLSLPEVFLLQGQAAILKERIGLNDPNDPPFFALISISSTSVEAALGVNYKIPDNGSNMGKVVTVTGVLELAFFWGNSFSWYLNLGKETPEDRRIRARIFDLFDCYFFLMISSEGIYTGAGASYSFNKTFVGVVKVKLEAYLDIRGKISFKPLQIGGSIQLGASLEISVFGIGFGLSADAGLAAEAPKPFIISGFVKVKIKVLWKTFKFNVDFTWNFDNSLDLSEIPLIDEIITNCAKAINAHTKEPFPVFTRKLPGTGAGWPTVPWTGIEGHTVPLDSFIDVEFKQGVNATGPDPSLARFNDITSGFDYSVMVPPQKGKSSQVKHEFFVDKVELKIWNPQTNSWNDYHPYKAMSPMADLPFLDLGPYATYEDFVDSKNLKFGSWQVRQPNKYNTLRVLATNPLSYMTQSVPMIPEELQITSSTLFCPDPPRQKICIDLARLGVSDKEGNTVSMATNQNIVLDGVLFRLIDADGKIVHQPFSGVNEAVRILSGSRMEIYLDEPSTLVSLLLQLTTQNVRISYYKRFQSGLDASQMPVFGWELVSSTTKDPLEASAPVVYDDPETPVGKIIVTAGECQKKGNSARWSCKEDTLKIDRLETFLNTLLKTGRLGNAREANLSVGVHSKPFTRFLQKEVLWNEIPKSITIKSKYNKDGTVYILLQSKKTAWRCEIKLAPKGKGDFTPYRIARFFNLRVDPGVTGEGENGAFLVDAEIISNGVKQLVTFSGTSCIPLRNCTESNRGKSNARITKDGRQLNSLLLELARQKRLVQTRKLNTSTGKYAAEFAYLKKLPLFTAKGSIYFEAEKVSSNDLGIQLRFDKKMISLQLETEQEGPRNFLIERIESFENLRAHDRKTGSGDNNWFLIDALFKGQKVTLTGKTNVALFEPEEELTTLESETHECEELTEQAIDLQGFLSTLGELKHLTSERAVPLGEFDPYNAAYFETTLSPKGATKRRTTWQMISQSDAYHVIDCLLISYVKEKVKTCRFHLEIIAERFKPDFRHLVSVSNIQPDPQPGQDGTTYHFTAMATFNYNGTMVETAIKGSSCYPIASCEEKKCAVLLYKLCYLPEADNDFNQTIPDISVVQQTNQAMVDAMSKLLQPVWRPQSVFGLRIETRDFLTAEGSPKAEYKNAYFIGFKTAGPLGHFHEYFNLSNVRGNRPDYQALLAADKEDEFKLQSLKYYVDLDKSYPNADGRLTFAKPLFYRDPKLLLFFIKDYVYTMYGDWATYAGNAGWDSELQAAIIDPADNPENPTTIVIGSEWERNEVPYINTDEQILINFQANGAVCTTTTQITKIGVNASFGIPELIPLKTYAAQFNARFKKMTDAAFTTREVHRYVFSTSRYPDFSAQVNSYITLTDYDPVTHLIVHQEKAFYEIAIAVEDSDITVAQSVLAGTDSDALKTEFMHPFDRLMSGALKMPAQDAAPTTEFNVVSNSLTGDILGILIRNPEPFNDPKIPVTVLNAKGVIELSANGGPANQFSCVYSKDLSAVFITNADRSMAMPAGSYQFTFRYLEYNPNISDYTAAATVTGITMTIS